MASSSQDSQMEERIAEMMARYPHIDRNEAAFRTIFTKLKSERVEEKTQVELSGQLSDDDDDDDDSDMTVDDSDEEDDTDMDSSDDEISEQDEQDGILPGAGAMIVFSSSSTLMPDAASTSQPTQAVAALPPPLAASTQPTSLPPTPSPEQLKQYFDSLKLTYYTLVVVRIIYESYVTAHHEMHAPAIQNHRILDNVHNPPTATLIEYLLGIAGCPLPLITLPDLRDIHGLSFPGLTSPSLPMPQSFVLPPLEPRPSRETFIEPTRNAASSDIVKSGDDWRRLRQIKSLLETLGYTQHSAFLSTGELNVPYPPPGNHTSVLGNPIGAPQPNEIRRAKRVIKPLPKCIHAVPVVPVIGQSAGSTTVVDSMVGAAMGVGSAIASGVKRLRSGLEEGGLRGWKRTRID